MKRPEGHILEDESKIKFKGIMPRNWVIRDQIPDYGYDFDVQIFNGNVATPFHFYVQLKSSKSIKKIASNIPFVFETKDLKMYYQGHFPVMLCVYIQELEKFYYIWVDDYFNSLNFKDYKDIIFQNYKTLYFNNLIPKNNLFLLEEEAKRLNYIRNPNLRTEELFKINIFFNSFKSKIILNKILIFYYYAKEIDFFKIVEVENENVSNFIIDLKQKNVKIKFTNKSLTFPILLKDNSLNSEFCFSKDDYDFLKSLSIPLCFLLLQNGFARNAANLLINCFLENNFTLDQKYLFEVSHFIAIILSKGEKQLSILDIAKIFVSLNMLELADWYSNLGRYFSSHLKEDTRKYNLKYITFQEYLLEAFKDKKNKGTSFYNMANTLRSLSDFKKAIKYYFCAKRNSPEYQKRSYWWAELAGCFFMINKNIFSEKFYKKATDLGEKNIPTKPLMADSLLYQGKYSRAVEVFKSYFNGKDFPDPSFLLKFTLAKFLSYHFTDSQRKPQLATDTVNKIIFSNKEENEKTVELRKALELDPLNGYAWYSYAVSISKVKENDKFLEWMITSIIQPSDLESWSNTFILMFQESFMSIDPVTFSIFGGQAVNNFGIRFFISLEKILRENNLDESTIEEIINSFKNNLSKVALLNYKGFTPFIFRFF